MSGATCTRRAGRGVCGGLLDIRAVDGRLVETCPLCVRRVRGLCRECPRPVYGTVGKAIRCEECARAARRRAWQKHGSHPEVRRRRLESDRKRWRKDAGRRARKREQRKAWAAAHPDRVKRSRRKYHLKRTPGYVAGYQRANANPERAAKKREQARRRYYELHPTRPAPVCAACSLRIDWEPKPGGRAGRPPKYHMLCSPWRKQRKDYRQQLAAERAA